MTELRASYPYWKLENGQETRVRLLFDTDKSNRYLWSTQKFLNFKKYLEDVEKSPVSNENVDVIGRYIWDSAKCPTCGHRESSTLNNNMQNLYHNLILKHHYAHILIVDDGLSLHNGEIMKLMMHETYFSNPNTLFSAMKKGIIDPYTNFKHDEKSNDFIIKKTEKNKFVGYNESRWDSKKYLLNPEQILIINNANLPPLSAYLEESTDDETLMKIFNRLVEMKAGFLM